MSPSTTTSRSTCRRRATLGFLYKSTRFPVQKISDVSCISRVVSCTLLKISRAYRAYPKWTKEETAFFDTACFYRDIFRGYRGATVSKITYHERSFSIRRVSLAVSGRKARIRGVTHFTFFHVRYTLSPGRQADTSLIQPYHASRITRSVSHMIRSDTARYEDTLRKPPIHSDTTTSTLSRYTSDMHDMHVICNRAFGSCEA